MNRFFHLATATLLCAYLLSATTIAIYPPGTNLENIAVGPNGDLFVTSVDSGTVYQVSPNGSSRVFGQVPAPLTGIGFNTDGTLVVATGTSIYRFQPDGTPSLVTNIAGAQSLNGLTLFSPGNILVADDGAATIWKVNLNTGVAFPWLTGDLLAPHNDDLPIGPNGVKLFSGAAYITNTGAGNIIRVPILPDSSAGTPAIYASGLGLDDFAIGLDGSLFLATQVENSVIRLYPDGTRVTVATEADGLLGDSALAFGRTAADSQDIYVVNNGGVYEGLPDGPQAASVVRLATSTTGAVPELQAVPELSTIWLSCCGISGLLLFTHLRTRRRLR